MVENDKYFYPDIEDIRIGYEFEFQEVPKGWHTMILSLTEDIEKREYNVSMNMMKYHIDRNNIRVPYLTNEQIEAEGWDEYISLIPENKTIFNFKTIDIPSNYFITVWFIFTAC